MRYTHEHCIGGSGVVPGQFVGRSRMDFQDAVTRYLRSLQELGRSPKTRKNHRQALCYYCQWLGRAQLDWQTVPEERVAAHLADYAEGRTKANARIYRCVLTAFFALAAHNQWVERSPIAPRPSPRPTRRAELFGTSATPGVDPAFAHALTRFYDRLLVRGHSEKTARHYERVPAPAVRPLPQAAARELQ